MLHREKRKDTGIKLDFFILDLCVAGGTALPLSRLHRLPCEMKMKRLSLEAYEITLASEKEVYVTWGDVAAQFCWETL